MSFGDPAISLDRTTDFGVGVIGVPFVEELCTADEVGIDDVDVPEVIVGVDDDADIEVDVADADAEVCGDDIPAVPVVEVVVVLIEVVVVVVEVVVVEVVVVEVVVVEVVVVEVVEVVAAAVVGVAVWDVVGTIPTCQSSSFSFICFALTTSLWVISGPHWFLAKKKNTVGAA
jgi:hypothetical protein